MNPKYPFPSTGFSGLDAFFAATVPYLRGELSPEAMVDLIGPSDSGTKRLGIYPWLVQGDNRHLLAKMFHGARAAAERHRLGLWDRLMQEYQSKHPPTDWRVPQYGKDLFDFVRNYRETRAPDLPLYIEELVDIAFVRGVAMCAPPVVGDDVMDKTVFTRQYTHTTPQFIVAVKEDPGAPLPLPQPTVTLIYRSVLTLRPRFFYPTVGALLALAQRTNTGAELRDQFKNVSEEAIAAGEYSLIEHGVLAERPKQA